MSDCSIARGDLCHEASARWVAPPNRSSATSATDISLGGTFLHWQTAPSGRTEVFGLDRPLLPKALAIRDWLLTEAAQLADSGQILPGFAERLIVLGIPIDRQRAPRHRQARGAATQA